MSSHPSPASTARPSDAPSRAPASSSEREDFLNSALARLSLSRVNSPAPPTLAQPIPLAVTKSGSSQSGMFETLGTRSSLPPAPLSQQEELPQPGSTFFSHSGSRTSSFTDGLMTPEEVDSLAGEVVHDFLFSDEEEVGGRSKERRLVFYHALCLQFDLCDIDDLPTTITQCKKLLSDVHICLREYLDAVENGENPRTAVKRHDSAHDLRKYLWEGPMDEKFIHLSLAKSELLDPFLVRCRSRRND